MTSAFASLSFPSLPPPPFISGLPPRVSDHRPSAPTSAFFHVRRAALCCLQFPTSTFHHHFLFSLTHVFSLRKKEKKGLLFFSCLYFVNRYSLWSVTSSISDDDGAAVPCPSRHPTASWVASRPPDGSRSTSKCRSPWCWHGSTGASRCFWPRGSPSHSGRSDDGWNASWCCNNWPGGSGT